jgi:diguanylate cyclase (GGDEF)-like protein
MPISGKSADSGFTDESSELRRHICGMLRTRSAIIVNDALSDFRFPLAEVAGGARGFAERVVQLLEAAARDGEIDPRSPDLSDLRLIARDRGVPTRQLFELVYRLERSGLDELALDESLGATSGSWPRVAEALRRASFEVLAALADHLGQQTGADALTDGLTTLHTRAVLLAALEKELRRSKRFGHPFALIVFDVDRLTAINQQHGYGVGDRVLERVGIVLRNYFREQDWVSRCAGDRFAVLLPETADEHAILLADRVRLTVQERLTLPDYKSDTPVSVTVSVAVVIALAVDACIRADQVLREAEQAVKRAKHSGRNRVERVEIAVQAAEAPGRGEFS